MTKKEVRNLRQLVAVTNQRRVYRWLRNGSGRDQFSLQSLCDDLNISSRSLAQSSLQALAKVGLVERVDYAGQIEWHVRPIAEARPLDQGFRGASSIQVRAAVNGLGKTLERSEEAQLFLALQAEPQAASLYRQLRLKLGQEITMTELAQLHLAERKTIKAKMARLGELRLLQEINDPPTILLKFVDCGLDGDVGPAALKEWLKTEAAPPVPLGRNKLLLESSNSTKQASLILDFFYKASAAASGGDAVAKVNVERNQRVAHNLARNNTFKQLMPALLFFVFDYRSDQVDQYGRSLMTFQKNLPAIQEELSADSGDWTYVERTMKGAGLDHFFEVPKSKKPGPANTDPDAKRKLDEWRGFSSDDIDDDDEDYTPLPQPKPVRPTGEQWRKIRERRAREAKMFSTGTL